MKQLLPVYLACLLIISTGHSLALAIKSDSAESLRYILPDIQSHTQQRQDHDRILYYTALMGTVMSLGFWTPVTKDCIEKHGVGAAIVSTLIPRVALDILIIIAMLKALKNKAQE